MNISQRNARYKLRLRDVKELDTTIRFALYEGIFLPVTHKE